MKYDIIQIAGFVLMVLGAQSTLNQIMSPESGGLVAWIPGGPGVHMALSIGAALAGAVLTSWAYSKTRTQNEGDDEM